jgi:two-component system response regulator (stage 0 sporulation protein A)
MNRKETITNTIKKLGISANLSGYHYIREAVDLIIDNFNYINAVTKELYPDIAKKFSTTPPRVERAIRHAIETGMLRADIEWANEVFGYNIDFRKGKPTNSEFLSTIADYIALQEAREKNDE